MSLRILQIAFICAICAVTFSQHEVERHLSYQEMAKIVVKLQERLEHLGVQVENITISSRGNHGKPDKGQPSYSEMAKFMMKLQEKFEHLNVKVDKLELIPPTQKPAVEKKPAIKKVSVCDKNPCLNGGRCVVLSSGKDYKCSDCPSPTKGKNCEQISCGGNQCFVHKGMKYTVLPLRSNWPRAKVLCIRSGMSLAMPKNRETDESIRQQLKAIYGSNSRTRLWFGLKRIGRFWHWVDGSLLGEYTGGEEWFPNKKPCASMYANGEGWHPDFCAQNSGYYYYPLCEKRIF